MQIIIYLFLIRGKFPCKRLRQRCRKRLQGNFYFYFYKNLVNVNFVLTSRYYFLMVPLRIAFLSYFFTISVLHFYYMFLMKKLFTKPLSRRLVFLLCYVCLPWSLRAQNPVSGKVTSSDGASLPGVTVLVKGTTTGTASDTEGKFTISAPSDGTLVFSFIGYVTEEVAIGGRSQINIELVPDL